MPDAPRAVVKQLTLAEQELQRVAHIAQQPLGFYREWRGVESVDMPVLVESVLALHSLKALHLSELIGRVDSEGLRRWKE
jgi:hypothetical protein